MKKQHFLIGKFLFGAILLLGLAQCAGEPDPDPDPDPPAARDIQLTSPMNQQQYTIGDEIKVSIQVNHPDLVSDIELYVADTLYQSGISLENQDIIIPTKDANVGNINIYVLWKDGKGQPHRDNRLCTLFSDITPVPRSIEVVKKYIHNPSSYTQGLEFYQGRLYEGTGQKGKSYLHEINLLTGAPIRSEGINADYFGEGITILNDTIYQLTYQAQKCLVYDMEFNLLTEFSYQGEGWGLCNNGESLLMSNGSDRIVWRDPRTFQITKEIQVFDDQKNVAQLNELELIDGSLFANVYTESFLIEIDTANGKVLSYIDCTPVVAEQPIGVDWLNGIAHDKTTGKTYITGKLYPALYEVTFE